MAETGIQVAIGAIKATSFVYDVVSYPFYAVAQQPWKKRSRMNKLRAKKVGVTEGVCYRTTNELSDFEVEMQKAKIETVEQALSYACNKYKTRPCLGTREILKEEDELQPSGKIFKKNEMGEYQWKTYGDVDDLARQFGKGMRLLGAEPKQNVVVFSETREEWLISAIGLFKQNIPVATLYATLGDDAVVHGINETGVSHVVTSHDLLPKFKSILERCPLVTHLIYFKDQLKETPLTGYKEDTVFSSFEEVVSAGRKSKQADFKNVLPSRDDTAIVMYTSGSTGAPKGVVMSHHNVVVSMIAYSAVLEVHPDDVYMAFLPQAHVLELMGEAIMLLYGVRLGYSSPLTMTDRSTKIKKGGKGDATVLKPTVMAAVPLILDRIYKTILEKLDRKPLLAAIFDWCVKYKINWMRRGWKTPIMDLLIFRRIRELLGGNLRLMAVGGAPLAPDTHDFIRVSLSVPVIQGYGLTETCACATLMDVDDVTTGRVGSPLAVCDVKLVNWEEGNYRITDTPRPRGEIVIGGDNIAQGYYKNPEKTREDFFEMDDRRWFRTGDIGEIDDDGVVKIIDRKKDLVKLQYGEYVSLGKVETELKVNPLVENMCVYGDSSKMFTVAIVNPAPAKLAELAETVGIKETDFDKLCEDSKVCKAVLQQLTATGKKAKLEKFELPGAVTLTPTQWTPDTDLVTAAFKIKRKNIQTVFQDDINRMYGA